jgi:tripartite-type tricarboxylate transporter receptor subunit TctC
MAGCALAGRALAWPQQPIRILVAYPPGGLSDEIARAIARQLSAQLGTAVVVENRAGAGGTIAMTALARSPPDGHTLCFSAISPLVLSPLLVPVGYDPQRDIAAVISVMVTPVMIVGTPAFTGTHFADLLAQGKARPGALRWATSGRGTLGHIVAEQVALHGGVRITHIPYKGGGPQLTDALGGEFELLSTNVAPLQLRHVAAGGFKPLAVGAPSRLAVLPEVPTLAELGFSEANLMSVFGLFAPAATPDETLTALNAELDRVVAQPQVRGRLLAANNVPTGGSREDFSRLIAEQSRSFRRLFEDEKQSPVGR